MGWGGLGSQALPDTVFKIDYAHYGWLFPRMAMLIHHGGSGTTAFGLRAGIPACVVSFVFDQFYWGERIAGLGAGPKPIRHTQLSVENLSHAIRQGAGDGSMRQKAAELGRRIRAENGIENAAQIIGRILRERRRS